MKDSGGDYKYSRMGNPTRDELESTLARLEGAEHSIAVSSGMSAISTVCLSVLSPGDRVVSSESIYSGTRRMFEGLLKPMGVDVVYVDATDPQNVADAVDDDTKIVWAESPTNPLLKLCDIRGVADVVADAVFVVDNTFSTPCLQKPLKLGADVVVYSATKFLNGHNDALGGAVVTDDDELTEGFRFVGEAALGAVAPAFNCYLVRRGLKTLPARMERHVENAEAVARFLEDHPRIERVYYPGLESHPQHDLATEQMDGYGGVVSFEVEGGVEEAEAVLRGLDIFNVAVSLGGVESLIEHTATMSAERMTDEERAEAGISDSLLRAPVGIENADDLVDDLRSALSDAYA